MRGRRAEQRHHRIADELLDGPAEPLELGAQMRVVRREQRTHVLRVEALGASGEADEIREQDGHHLPLLATLPRRLVDRGPAEGAERELPRQLLPASRARHSVESRPSSGARPGR